MELAYHLGAAAVLTVIIVANLWERKNPRTELARILWGRFGKLMYLGMGFLAILVAFSLTRAAIIAGWAGSGAIETALPLLGLATGVLAVALLFLTGRAIVQFRRGGTEG